ncbi:MAG: hypothetical protein EXS16_04120 [Gemmataceae bacterium]|nr:hypothetical protein [Gemmataceae bacterium]
MTAETDALLKRAASAHEIPATVQLPPDVVARVGNHGTALLLTKIVYEWRFVGWFLKALGTFMLLLAAFMFIMSLIFWIVEGRIREKGEEESVFVIIFMFIFAGGFGYGGFWFVFLRQAPSALRVWFVRNGIVWHFNDTAYFLPWNGFELLSKRHYFHIDLGLLLPFGNERTWFWVFNTPANRNAVASIEVIASAARLPQAIHYLACGRALVFGKWSISATEFMPWADPMKWDDIEGIEKSGNTIILLRRGQGNVKINVSALPFPSLYLALTRGLIAYWKSQSSNHETTDSNIKKAGDKP